jgi:hypothetical protein
MAFVLAHGEQITFLAQVSLLGLLSIFESIDEVWLYNIYIASMLFSFYLHSYELHVSLSYRKRKA